MRYLIIISLLLTLGFAKSFLASPTALPKSYILNTDIEPCSDSCLENYLELEEVFSFLANQNSATANKKLREAMMIYSSYFNIDKVDFRPLFKVALLIPHKIIGKYAVTTNNAVFAYLIAKNQSFSMKTFYIDDESNTSLESALVNIQAEGFSYVIAPLTRFGAQTLADINPNMHIFFPTIHKKDIVTQSKTLYFGGIDYEAQIQKLLQYAQGYTALFYDPSDLGQRLNDTVEQNIEPKWIRFATPISRHKSNLKKFLEGNTLLQEGTIFINTKTVHSAIALSQLTLYDIEPAAILYTQINYDPLILSMTQENDRKNMYIANSIENTNNVIIEANRLLDNNIVYDRINYATTLGIDYFLSETTSEEREYTEEMKDNQIIYPISIYTPTLHGFKRLEE